MSYITPPLKCRGRFTVSAPFTVEASKIYVCIALRDFDDVVKDGEQVFEKYYEPYGLTATDYNRDRNAEGIIVSLADEFGDVLYIPNFYIQSFPNMGDVPYHHLVLSCSLGAVPAYLDVSTLVEVMQTKVVETVGITDAVVSTHIAPARSGVSPAEHDILEANRTAGITYNETYKAKYLKSEAKVAVLEERNGVLLQLLIDNGILT